jgi:predicted aconitase
LALGPDVPAGAAATEQFWPVLGYVVGELAGGDVVSVEGLEPPPGGPPREALKAFFAAAASSGSVALAHLVGLTPEAATVQDAFMGPPPTRVTRIGRDDLRRAWAALSTLRPGDPVDVVVLGSPHFSREEFRRLARLTAGRRRAPGCRVMVTTGHVQRELARRDGSLAVVEAFGAEVVVDTCILLAPLLPAGTATLVTNSGKYAHYAPGLLRVRVGWQSLSGCVATAEAGSWTPDGPAAGAWM